MKTRYERNPEKEAEEESKDESDDEGDNSGTIGAIPAIPGQPIEKFR